jgi:hypothetical protein
VVPDAARLIPLAGVEASSHPDRVDRLADGNRRTAWISDGPQRGGETLTVTLADRHLVLGVVLAHGPFTPGFPRQLTIEVAEEPDAWRPVWRGPTGARTVAAALDDPREVRLYVEFAPVEAKYVRLTQTGTSGVDEWAVAELAVVGR